MIRKGDVDPNPCSHMLTDLATLVKTKQKSGCEVIGIMDGNKNDNPGTQWCKFIEDNVLHDVHETLVPRRSPTTMRHCNKIIIDYVLASKGILNYARTGEYGALCEGYISNHVLL